MWEENSEISIITIHLILLKSTSAYLYPLFLSFESPRVLLKKNGGEIYLPFTLSQVNKGDKTMTRTQSPWLLVQHSSLLQLC